MKRRGELTFGTGENDRGRRRKGYYRPLKGPGISESRRVNENKSRGACCFGDEEDPRAPRQAI